MELFYLNYIYIMGRPKIKQENKKLKFGISLDPILYQRIKKDGYKISTFIDGLIRNHYENKNMS
jgi:hypothetical protein